MCTIFAYTCMNMCDMRVPLPGYASRRNRKQRRVRDRQISRKRTRSPAPASAPRPGRDFHAARKRLSYRIMVSPGAPDGAIGESSVRKVNTARISRRLHPPRYVNERIPHIPHPARSDAIMSRGKREDCENEANKKKSCPKVSQLAATTGGGVTADVTRGAAVTR